MSDPLVFRPHHFLCALGFQGKGYDSGFTENMAGIVARLRRMDGDDVMIEVRFSADTICAPCPHRRGTGCTHSAKIATLDHRHAQALGLQDGTRLTWGDARARIRAQIPAERLDALCAGCQWLDHGLCRSALDRLHRDGAERP